VEIAARREKTYDIKIGSTLPEDRICAPQFEAAIATVMGLLPEQVNVFVQIVTQEEVDLHFGIYERMLAEKLGTTPPLQRFSRALRTGQVVEAYGAHPSLAPWSSVAALRIWKKRSRERFVFSGSLDKFDVILNNLNNLNANSSGSSSISRLLDGNEPKVEAQSAQVGNVHAVFVFAHYIIVQH